MMHIDVKCRVSLLAICFPLFVLAPSLAKARETVDVSFSVKAVRIQDTITSHLAAETEWAFVAADLDTGERRVEAGVARNTPLIPGSLMKLFVTAAILEQSANKAVDLRTVIAVNGNISKGKLLGDVIIKGAGNPLLTEKDLLAGVEKIKSLGLKEINGDVVVDASLFDVKSWKSRYNGPAYGVTSSLGLDMHTLSITSERSLQRVVIDPPNDAVKVSFNPAGKSGIRQIDDLTYEVTGAAQDAPIVRRRFSLMDPSLYAGGTLMTLLRKQGIVVSGIVRQGRCPAEASQVASIGSHDLKALISNTNKQSLNVAADNMLFMLGAFRSGAPGTREKGIQAVKDFLRELGVQVKGLVINDGSGVSERNRVTAEQMVEFLRLATEKPWFDAFYESLSRPGLDGRLREFGYRSERVRMKSGQLPDAYGLAGYVDRPEGRKIAFAYMVNGQGSDMQVAASVAVEVLKQLVE